MARTGEMFGLYRGNLSSQHPFTPAATVPAPYQDRKANAMGELAGPDLGSVLSLMPVDTSSLNKTPAKLYEWEECGI